MTSFARPTANRAVHLRITPRPSNLGESREILRLISQFGDVEYFKNLRYDAPLSAPNTALVIYKEEKAATECLRTSPIRFRMGRVGRRQLQLQQQQQQQQKDGGNGEELVGEVAANWGVNNVEERASPRGPIYAPFGFPSSPANQTRTLSTSSLPTPPPNPIRMPFDLPPEDNNSPNNPNTGTADDNNDDSETTLFQIQTNPSRRNFRDQINASHYNGPFPLDSKMPGQQDLVKKVPLAGLSCVDWRKAEVPWRVVQQGRKREEGWLLELGLGRAGVGGFGRGRSESGDVSGRFDGRSVEDFGGEEQVEKDEVETIGSVVKKENEKEKDVFQSTEGEEDALSRAMKGWEQFFPGISSGRADSVERYSRKRK